ncbi:hypothetical protein BU23DRAFT_602364 [Bimuria novae-zelandiae CBS 107.79]|uniref:Uncharacterized protein n=1 Tax=Bimuria novae-zelandiae CBS 107.79 TaxID=1447943 RepID=A0A6A5V4E5_9PLEO|nr:hypothetical protein BU23DRAFT_602364 [Bimuria novae-zelandiae CBS 107.79]
MTDVLPKIRVNDPHARDAGSLERQDTGKFSVKGDGSLANGGKVTTKLRNPATSPSWQSNGESKPAKDANNEKQERPAIDPLSQQILQRTNTTLSVQKLRLQNGDSTGQSPTSPQDAGTDTKLANDTSTREVNGGGVKADKKKGVSFLSRFIGNKKRGTLDGTEDNDSQAGDRDPRPEGMDAQLFSHTVDNMGFSPKHPQPPAYIKMRSKYKKEKEFDRVFLAQELRTKVGKKRLSIGPGSPVAQSGSAGVQNPIWATEFSKDGRYLAAGGQDKVVRVWAVISTAEERRAHENDEHISSGSGESKHLSAPVFQQQPFREYAGHTSTILDLSWSKNNFLLSSSMDKTVRLWHISRSENLCTFKHNDFVPSIQFHPRDDRFFLAGSLDTKLRLWSIPDKSVAYTVSVPDMITAVAFTPDGKTCIAGTLGGLCLFYDTEGFKWQSQIHVKSTRGQNAKGSKITGIQAVCWPPGSSTGDVKLLVTSNDSRVRVYGFREKNLEMKFRGHENNCSQIRASFADDTEHIICGSEDRKAYIWSTNGFEEEKRNQRPMEMFEAHGSITTCATIAPLKTRQLLSASEDPIFDLCNPPPVTLVSRETSVSGSKPPTEAGGSVQPTPTESNFRKVAESPAYIARSAHTDGHIIVTADYTGAIKVYRQDCAYHKRARLTDNWDALSRRTGSIRLGRPSSIVSTRTSRTRRDSTSTQPANERIMSWQQNLSHGAIDSPRRSIGRSISPRKSKSRTSMASTRPNDSPALGPMPTLSATTSGRTGTPKTSLSIDRTSTNRSIDDAATKTPPSQQNKKLDVKPRPGVERGVSNFDPVKMVDERRLEPSLENPAHVYNGQSWAFWNMKSKLQNAQKNGFLAPSLGTGDEQDAGERPELGGRGERPELGGRGESVPSKAKESQDLAPSPLPFPLQQLLLNIFRDAFHERLAEGIKPLLQEIKGHLYNRDFAAAFGKQEYLEAYALRWSPSRALGYLDIFSRLKDVLGFSNRGEREKGGGRWEVVCLGGGAGAEIVALGGLMKVLALGNEGCAAGIKVRAVDIADWASVTARLREGVVNKPPLSKYASAAAQAANEALTSPASFAVGFHQHDVLNMDADALSEIVDSANLVTLMFTLNELYTTSLSLTQKFLLNLTTCLTPGVRLLVVDSPGSYSTVSLNGAEKKYPMQWLLDHTLLSTGAKGTEEAKWEKVEEEEM